MAKTLFDVEIIHYPNISPEALAEVERWKIRQLDSFHNGYNQTEGGEGIAGFKHTEETRRKQSEAHKGKTLSKEHRQKLSESHKGYNPSKETRRKQSEAHKDRILSKEHRQKLSEVRKGKKHTRKTCRKMSEGRLGISQKALKILIGWLLNDGWTQTKIANKLRLSRPTIRKYKP